MNLSRWSHLTAETNGLDISQHVVDRMSPFSYWMLTNFWFCPYTCNASKSFGLGTVCRTQFLHSDLGPYSSWISCEIFFMSAFLPHAFFHFLFLRWKNRKLCSASHILYIRELDLWRFFPCILICCIAGNPPITRKNFKEDEVYTIILVIQFT